MVSLQTTFLKQFFDIAQGKRVAKIPADRTKNQLRFGLPPLEDRRPGCHWVLFKLPAAAYGSCNTTVNCVHDEIICECDESDVGYVKELIELAMIKSFQTMFREAPIVGLVEASSGLNWGGM
jgi:hypothetical protein